MPAVGVVDAVDELLRERDDEHARREARQALEAGDQRAETGEVPYFDGFYKNAPEEASSI